MTSGSAEEWSDEAIEAFWRPRGPQPGWTALIVVAAAAVTLALVAVLGDLAFAQVRAMLAVGHPPGVLRYQVGAVLGGVVAAGVLALWWSWRHRDVPWWVRLAVALVAVHVALAIGAAYLSRYLERDYGQGPALSINPATWVAAVACMLVLAGAALAGVRRRGRRTGAPRWMSGTVVFALAFLALLGLWMPIVFPRDSLVFWDDPRGHMLALRTLVVVPPATLALLAALVAALRPAWSRLLSAPLAALLGIGLVAAVVRRVDAGDAALAMYNGFAHMLFAAAGFALCAIAALAWTHARALHAHRVELSRPEPWVQRGTVEAPAGEGEVGAWIVDGWLAGMRGAVTGFTLRTPRGARVPVPAGARVVAPVPVSTANADAGDRVTVLAAGDAVLVSGFVVPAADGPYRGGGAPVPGAGGLIVSVPRRAHETVGRDVLLVLYRPCVLFLVIAAMTALPGIVR